MAENDECHLIFNWSNSFGWQYFYCQFLIKLFLSGLLDLWMLCSEELSGSCHLTNNVYQIQNFYYVQALILCIYCPMTNIYLSYDNKYRQNILESLMCWPSQNYYFKNRKFVTPFLDYFPTERKGSLTRTVFYSIKKHTGTFLVGQWLGICLPMQETHVWSLGREDPTCCGATKPRHPNYGSPCTLGSMTHSCWALMQPPLKPMCPHVCLCPQQKELQLQEAHTPQLESILCSLQLEKAHRQQWRPAQSKINK